jgi:hypothetical protein
MLKLFGGKPDHPMADPKELRRILDDLPAQDPHKALEELTHWHESVGAAEGFRFEQRLSVHLQIDDAAQARVRRLSRDYLAAASSTCFARTSRNSSSLRATCRRASACSPGCVLLSTPISRGCAAVWCAYRSVHR